MHVTVTTTVEMTGGPTVRADGTRSHGETIGTTSAKHHIGNARYLAEEVADLACANAAQVARSVEHLFGSLKDRTQARITFQPGRDHASIDRTRYDTQAAPGTIDAPHPLAFVGQDVLNVARKALTDIKDADREALADGIVAALRQAGFLNR